MKHDQRSATTWELESRPGVTASGWGLEEAHFAVAIIFENNVLLKKVRFCEKWGFVGFEFPLFGMAYNT